MLKNYLIVTFRNILRNPSFTLINFLGLSIGIAGCLLIVQYLVFEKSYDRFHSNYENIYRIRVEGKRNSGQMQFQSARNFSAAGPEVYSNFEEVLGYTRLHNEEALIRYKDPDTDELKTFVEDRIMYADTSLFQIFDFPLIMGDPVNSLREPYSILLSESMAEKYFGPDWQSKNIINQTFIVNSELSVEATGSITGIFKDIPANSHLKFDMLFSYSSLLAKSDFYHTNWSQNSILTYLRLEPGTDPRVLESKFPPIIDKHKGDYFTATEYREDFYLQALKDIHLNSHFDGEAEINGDAQSVFFLSIIAVFVLIIAWVNYVNLSTAKAMDRAKEVGIRKVNGAFKNQLIIQFLLETTVIKLASVVLAITIVQLIMPAFSELVGKSISFTLWKEPGFSLYFSLVTISGILFAGGYPAIILSAYKPAVVLKGKFIRSRQGVLIRKFLVILQFVISVSLIAGTLTVYNQLKFMQSQNLGVEIEQTLVIEAPMLTDEDSDLILTYQAFKNTLLQNPNIESVSTSTFVPGERVWGWGGYIRRANTPPDQAGAYRRYFIDHEFFESYGIELLTGRFFSKEIANDSTVVILTENASKKLGFESPESAIGKHIYYPLNFRQDKREIEVIGVVKDFHQGSLKQEFQPLIFELLRSPSSYYSVKIISKNMNDVLEYVGKSFKIIFSESPFNYFFLDDFYNASYKSDQQFGKVFGLFSILAIIVACLGLFGLSSYTIQQRTKELGIRKVLGAPILSLFKLLTVDFLKAILIANLIALPLMYYVLEGWLKNYPFRIELGLWLLVIPLLVVLIASLFTVIIKTMKATISNPINSLRDD